jgi:sRNA-binding carbon storage regulator CsrA
MSLAAVAKGSALIETTDDVFREIKTKLREYNESTVALLARASEIYEEITGETTNPSTMLSELIADTYRELLRNVTPEQLNAWAGNYSWLGEKLSRKRNESVFYRDSVVILLGLLITENAVAIPKKWPVDSSHLEDLYTMMGISTSGLF